MGYLKLTRRIGDALVLGIHPGTDPQVALEALQREGIRVFIRDARSNRAQLGIEAPESILVLREELLGEEGIRLGPNLDQIGAGSCR